jgi:hypothetical protein
VSTKRTITNVATMIAKSAIAVSDDRPDRDVALLVRRRAAGVPCDGVVMRARPRAGSDGSWSGTSGRSARERIARPRKTPPTARNAATSSQCTTNAP